MSPPAVKLPAPHLPYFPIPCTLPSHIPDPAWHQVLDMFLKLGALGVRGNHDDAALYRWQQWSQHQQDLGERHAWLADLKVGAWQGS